MRLTSELWVKAYLRRCMVEGIPAVIVRRGAAEAGAIFIKVNRLDATADLVTPAPQTAFDQGSVVDRKFELALETADEAKIDKRLAREMEFDPDIWIVESEDRAGRHLVDIVRADRSSPF